MAYANSAYPDKTVSDSDQTGLGSGIVDKTVSTSDQTGLGSGVV